MGPGLEACRSRGGWPLQVSGSQLLQLAPTAAAGAAAAAQTPAHEQQIQGRCLVQRMGWQTDESKQSSGGRRALPGGSAASSPGPLAVPATQVDRSKDQLFFASEASLTYLDGSLPGDFGFDPLGLVSTAAAPAAPAQRGAAPGRLAGKQGPCYLVCSGARRCSGRARRSLAPLRPPPSWTP
jgi:hypothetical protein